MTIHFLSGLPRTGSTLLGSLLGQNPDIYVTPTSPMYSLLVHANDHFNLLASQYTFDLDATSDRIYSAMVQAFYAPIRQPVIFDKHRGWPKNIQAIKKYLNADPVIVATVRPIAEIITSYLVLAEKDENNFIDAHLRREGQPLTNESRAHLLWSQYLNSPYDYLTQGLATSPENILLIQYDDIVYTPHAVLNRIYAACNLDRYRHQIDVIENRCAEAKDEAWGLKNLHTIRPTLSRQSANPLDYLPREAVEYFSQFDIQEASCHARS